MVFTLLTEIFREQDIDYTTPLATIFRTPSEGTNAAIISLLEDVNAAHFAWALRDKDQLRHDAARMILERPTEQPQTA
jgi:hypothetical protein